MSAPAVPAVTPEVAAIAASVARDLREFGHYEARIDEATSDIIDGPGAVAS